MNNADIRPATRRLLFVADAAVADVDELPASVRAVIDAATEVHVITRGRTGLRALLLASVSSAVVNHADRPMLIARRPLAAA